VCGVSHWASACDVWRSKRAMRCFMCYPMEHGINEIRYTDCA
jgi:hypothetical protein